MTEHKMYDVLQKELITQYAIDYYAKTGNFLQSNMFLKIISIDLILKSVCTILEENNSDMSRSQVPKMFKVHGTRKIVDYKAIFCKIAQDHNYTVVEIAAALKMSSHASIVYLITRAVTYYKQFSEFETLYNQIKTRIYNDWRSISTPAEAPGQSQPTLPFVELQRKNRAVIHQPTYGSSSFENRRVYL